MDNDSALLRRLSLLIFSVMFIKIFGMQEKSNTPHQSLTFIYLFIQHEYLELSTHRIVTEYILKSTK